jgi:hypothetical protein
MYRSLFVTALLVFGGLGLPGNTIAGAWFRAAGGFSHMAMGDINGATFNFFDQPGADARFSDVGTGFVMDLGFGHDFSPSWSLGAHWDRQWASSSATDQGVDGVLNLNANFFTARGHWRPLRAEKWHLGALFGGGFGFCDGSARVTRGSTNYGERDVRGSSWCLDAAAILGWRLNEKAELQLQGGWRQATISKFEVGSVPVTRLDGSRAELDYSGWQIKVAVRWLLSGHDPYSDPEM